MPRGIAALLRACLSGLLVLLLIGPCLAAEDPWARFDTPWFDRIGISKGLPDSVTTAVAQDSRGLVWIGTMGGLVRYDGFRMQAFEQGAAGLRDSYVRALFPLPNGGMLVGTNTGGLSRFDPASNGLHNYPVDGAGSVDRKVYALADDHAHGVWIATERGLFHLDLPTDRIEPVATGPGISPRSFNVFEDKGGNLWLGNNNGLFVRRAGTDRFVRPETPPGPVTTVLHDEVWAIREDREQRLWVGSVQAGAVYLDHAGQWHTVPGFSGYQGEARLSTVRDFLEVGDAMWMATDGSGIVSYRPGQATVVKTSHDNGVPSSLPGDTVRALAQDNSGGVWAATDLGIAHYDPDARTAFSLLPTSDPVHGLANGNVRSIFVDSRERIWLGLAGGHIDIIDLKLGTMRNLRLGGNQAHRDVQAFAEDADGGIWVGTLGVAHIDPDTLSIKESVLPALGGKPVLGLLCEGHHLLITTYDGVYRYDLDSHALDHFDHVPGDAGSLPSDAVRKVVRIGDELWYLSSGGISIARDALQGGGFDNLLHRADDPGSLPQNTSSAAVLDRKHRVWVGTFGGLGLLDPYNAAGPYRFRTLDTADGLPSNKINAVVDDDHGNIWLSTSVGLAKVDGDSLAVHTLGLRDGLHIFSYIYTAASRMPHGELLFGGLGGLTVVRPDWQPPATAMAPLAITRAVIDGNELPYGRLPRSDGSVTLERSRSLRVDFALLDYQPAAATSYAYRMQGFDETWNAIPAGSPPTAIYTNLPYGNYRLQLRATTRGMQPRTAETSLVVEVAPHWYETWAARIAAVLAAIFLVYLLTQLRTTYLRRQAAQLQQQVEAHTSELRVANARLDRLASTDELTGVLNRRRFMELAEQVCTEHHDGNACIALFDLDHFKRINDGFGHMAGDVALRDAAAVMRQHCRAGDLLGRFGGEEFVLCLPGTAPTQATAICERIRATLAASPVEHGGRRIALTTSAGIAPLHAGESLNLWLSRADKALYRAKSQGRNRCVEAE